MNIKEVKKKNGTIVYRANVYLGTDRLTGKKARKNITASTKKALKQKPVRRLTNLSITVIQPKPRLQ